MNRYFFDDYMNTFQRSPFKSIDARGVWPVEMVPDRVGALRRRHPNPSEFEFQGIEITAVKIE